MAETTARTSIKHRKGTRDRELPSVLYNGEERRVLYSLSNSSPPVQSSMTLGVAVAD